MPTPISSYAAALSAYSRAAGAAGDASSATTPTTGTGTHGSFTETLKEMLGQAVDTGKASESQAMGAIVDHNDLAGVVTSVAEAEVMLQSVIAIRDRAIEAYKDISRMPI